MTCSHQTVLQCHMLSNKVDHLNLISKLHQVHHQYHHKLEVYLLSVQSLKKVHQDLEIKFQRIWEQWTLSDLYISLASTFLQVHMHIQFKMVIGLLVNWIKKRILKYLSVKHYLNKWNTISSKQILKKNKNFFLDKRWLLMLMNLWKVKHNSYQLRDKMQLK